jgi:hypothetical protein
MPNLNHNTPDIAYGATVYLSMPALGHTTYDAMPCHALQCPAIHSAGPSKKTPSSISPSRTTDPCGVRRPPMFAETSNNNATHTVPSSQLCNTIAFGHRAAYYLPRPARPVRISPLPMPSCHRPAGSRDTRSLPSPPAYLLPTAAIYSCPPRQTRPLTDT